MALWFDVDDLVAYFNAHRRPSGIQRVCFEIYREVWRRAGHTGEIRFCRHDLHYTKLIEIDWPALQRTIAEVTAKAQPDRKAIIKPLEEPAPPAAPVPELPAGPPRAPPSLRRLSRFFLRTRLRFVIGDAFYASATPAAGYLNAARALLTHFGLAPPPKPVIDNSVIDVAPTEPVLRPGDVLLALGSIWDPRFAPLLDRLRGDHGISFATIVYDLIPDMFPELTGRYLTELFRGWLFNVVPKADFLFTLSKAASHDLGAAMQRQGRRIPAPVILPLGANRARPKLRFRTAKRPFVLFVSTIEPRKNHELLLAVWEQLLARMDPEQVPDLVFAGRLVGGMAERFSKKIFSPALRQRVQIILEPEDQRLAALYADCLFTVFPSLYEGWGLPVSESLGFGKPVAASNRSSIPEAGGDFCVYYDPENVEEATEVIRGLIENPRLVAGLKKRIARSFRPPCWGDTAAALLAGLAAPSAAASPSEQIMERAL
jgi:glycosyltransferase involved in cell wall biosynthesis